MRVKSCSPKIFIFHRSFTNCECPTLATNCIIPDGISVAVATMYHENGTPWYFLVWCLIAPTLSIQPMNGLQQSKRFDYLVCLYKFMYIYYCTYKYIINQKFHLHTLDCKSLQI